MKMNKVRFKSGEEEIFCDSCEDVFEKNQIVYSCSNHQTDQFQTYELCFECIKQVCTARF